MSRMVPDINVTSSFLHIVMAAGSLLYLPEGDEKSHRRDVEHVPFYPLLTRLQAALLINDLGNIKVLVTNNTSILTHYGFFP